MGATTATFVETFRARDWRHFDVQLLLYVVLLIAVVLLPVFFRKATKKELWFGGACLAATILARDYWMPRYAYGLVLLISVVVGRSLSTLRASGSRPLYWAA